MEINKKCESCGHDYAIPHWRKDTAKFCSKKCQTKSLKAKNNTICTFCGFEFHMKQSQKDRYNRTLGFYCSKKCLSLDKKSKFKGENNHQFGLKGSLNSSFKGLEITNVNHNNIDILIYVPNHPFADKSGRVLKHRYIVEQNKEMFDDKFFIVINGFTVLKKEYHIHHKDENHNNDEISNLEILTMSDHTTIHNKNKIIIRDVTNGRIKTVIKKQK